MTEQETIYTEKEAANFLKVSAKTVSRHREANKLGFYKIGRRVVYSLENHLKPFLQACETVINSNNQNEVEN